MTDPPLALRVNGSVRSAGPVPVTERLLDTLRWRLDLKGTKEGCRTGDCGACTVLVDRRPTLSCLTLAHEVDGAEIETIEGLSADPVGRAVATAFRDVGAAQCGYCTPGFVVAVTGLLREEGRSVPVSRLKEELGGNLCRCTGYVAIARALERAWEQLP